MDDDSQDVTPSQEAESLARSRSKRTRNDKHGRLAALDRLKQLKGTKNKYEVSQVQNVYEEVDEREYSKRRQDRMEEDWIIDDDGSGYVEDGREIFDDDGTDEIFFSKKEKKSSKRKREDESSSSSSRSGLGNIKNMLFNMPAKKKVDKNVKLEEDDILGDILQDLENEPEEIKPLQPTLLKKKPRIAKDSPKGSINPFATKLKGLSPMQVKKSPKPLQPIKEPKNVTSPKAKRSLHVDAVESTKREEFDSMDLVAQDDLMDTEDLDDLAQALDQDDDNLFPSSTEDMDVKVKSPEKKSLVNKKEDNKENRGFVSKAVKEKDFKSTGWDTVKGEANEPQIPEVLLDSSKLPLVTNPEGEQVLRFYWLDAYEDYYNKPGTVFLFGKVRIENTKTFVSCCVTVRNIPRKVYVMKRSKRMDMKTKEEGDEITMMDVYQEMESKIMEQYKIGQFRSRVVTKNYAFDKYDVPNEGEYLEVQYSAEHPSLPNDLEGETFSHLFGTNTSSLETFLLDRKIKGPCWLDIKFPQMPSPPISWCKVEACTLKMSHISIHNGKTPPPLVVMTLLSRTVVNPKTQQNEIVMLGALVHQEFYLDKAPPQPPFQYHFCAMCRPSDSTWPWDLKDNLNKYKSTKVEKVDTERALLGFITAKIHKIDPDIITGHDIFGFDLQVLLHRITANKIPQWSRIGRLKRSNIPKFAGAKSYIEKLAMCGRLVCDVKVSAKELIRAKSYDLDALVEQILRVPANERWQINNEIVKKSYDNSSTLLQLVTATMQDASYVLRLMCELNILPLALQITNVAGNVMSRTLLGGRSERNEYLLLHAFSEKDYIVPDKQFGKANQKISENPDNDGEEGKKSGRKKPTYAGGLVLEPKKGFYDKYILLMDFNSLYPSIIQEYNICFTTMQRMPPIKKDGEEVLPDLPDTNLDTGILPTEIRKLVESRKQVKQLMKQTDISADLKLQYDIRQKALKITANSMYGCLGFSHSRFFAKHIAALVTGKGREILLQTRDLVQKMNLDVIYGDTDSIMINSNCTDYDQVFKLGNKIKSEVNKLYKQLELDVDGVFKYMLLLKKKKYAALTMTKLPDGQVIAEKELKGLDIVRRDWSQLACDAGKYIVDQILSDQEADERINRIHNHLEELKDKLDKGLIPLEELTITKQLTKNPEDYPDKKSLPHVQVAMRMNSRGGKKLRSGDTVPYVICEDGTNLAPTQRAYHVEELKANENLQVDKHYYLSAQIHPVVSRLIDPIEGTDASRVADCLGLDGSAYRNKRQYGHQDDDAEAVEQVSDEELYRLCDRFTFTCPSNDCSTLITMDSPFVGTGTSSEPILQKCPDPKCKFPIYSQITPLVNKLKLDIRRHISLYYEGWLVCEDPACNNRTRRVPLKFSKGFPVCNLCKRGVLFKECSEYKLYKQLCFYDHIFDYVKACQLRKDDRIRDDTLKKAYNILHNEIKNILKYNAYSEVNLGKIFAGLFVG